MKPTLSDYTYERLKNEILYAEYPIEGLLTEQTIADRYHVSRSPARVALLRLCSEGYLSKYPKKGYIVKNLHGRVVLEKRQVRYLLELGTASHIILHGTDEQIQSLYQYCTVQEDNAEPMTSNMRFHLALAGLLSNPTLVQEIQRLIDVCSPKIFDKTQEREVSFRYAEQHKAIVDALMERNYSKVADAVNADINMSILR